MTYATRDHIKEVTPERDLLLLTDFDGAADAVDDTKLDAALTDATAEINGYISKRVTLPLPETPDMLRVVCRELAIYRLHANVGRVTETQEKLRDAAISFLKQVQDGKTSIGDDQDTVQTSEGAVTAEGPERVMTRESLKGF